MKALAVTLAVLAGTVSLAGSAAARPTSGTLSIGDMQASEGTFGTRPLSFRATLSESSGGLVTVSYRTQNETAQAGEDYETTQGTLQFASGETAKTVEVPIRGDRKVEPDEFFSVVLFAPVNATIAQPGDVGTGTIQNDDVPAVICKCKRVKLGLAGFSALGTSVVVKATMTCGTGDVADCAGYVKAVSPFATLKPPPFRCRAKKCTSTNTYKLRVRFAQRPLKKKLRLRAGCRGKRGELRTFTLVFPSK
jgi:Calx-beta domain